MADQTQFGQLKRDDSNFPVGWKYATMTATGATIIKATPGVLHQITFNKPIATSVVAICDSASTSTGTFGTITIPASPQPVTLFYDVSLTNGLVINMSVAASDITIAYI